MIFSVREDLADLFGNTLRQILILNRSVIRPIAYNVNGISTVIGAGDLVMEDMVEFSVSLNRPAYWLSNALEEGEQASVYLASAEFTDVLTLDQLLAGSGIECSSEYKSMELLHVLKNSSNKPIRVEVFYALNKGNKTARENEFLLSAEIEKFKEVSLISRTKNSSIMEDSNLYSSGGSSNLSSSLVVMASHHSDVRLCTFKRSLGDSKSSKVNLDFKVETTSGVSEEIVVKEGLKDLQELFSILTI